LCFFNFWSTEVDRNQSSSQPGNTLDDEDIELPDEDEDAIDE
jgi:lariat debranching enzyme